MKKTVHFFDCDGTHFRDSLSMIVTEIAIEKGYISKEVEARYIKEKDAWKNREGTFDDFAHKQIWAVVEYYKGFRVDQFDECVQIFLDQYAKREYLFTRKIIEELKQDENNHLVMVSQSPERAVQAFAQFHGFHHSFGSWYELENGIFTGNAKSLPEKGDVIREYLRKNHQTLEVNRHSIGIGDTISDISLLESVKRPLCMNPSLTLAKHARMHGWPLIIERKDCVFLLHRSGYILIDTGKEIFPQIDRYCST